MTCKKRVLERCHSSCTLSQAAASLMLKANTRWSVLDLNNTGCHVLNILHLLERQRVWIYTCHKKQRANVNNDIHWTNIALSKQRKLALIGAQKDGSATAIPGSNAGVQILLVFKDQTAESACWSLAHLPRCRDLRVLHGCLIHMDGTVS